MLSKLHTIFVKFPFGMAVLCFIAVIFFIQRRRIGHGFFVDDFGERGENIFLPCSHQARRVLERVCRNEAFKDHKFLKLPFGARVVPKECYWAVYEGVMHDAEEPQCITKHSKLLNCHITDTP